METVSIDKGHVIGKNHFIAARRPYVIRFRQPIRGPERGLTYFIYKSERTGMILRVATFVDAGYFFAASSQAIKNKQVQRRNIRIVSPEKLLCGICAQSLQISKCPDSLRTYWYDAVQSTRPSLEQTEIATLAGVKLRLGTLNNAGEQKGVDSLIVTDLIELARNKAIADAILISGDEDLRIAVQVAQTYGVRVHILAVGDHTRNVSQTLKMEADSVNSLGAEWLAEHLEFTDTTKPVVVGITSQKINASNTNKPQNENIQTIEEAAAKVSKELLLAQSETVISELDEYFKANKSVPPEFDGKLIAKTGAALKRNLTGDEKRKARGVFINTIRGRLSPISN